MAREVFLCHATGDKEQYVRPLVAALRSHGITYWLDEAEIGWGDRITERINEGLAGSRYVLVFLTQNFLDRHWPQTELGGAIEREASSGHVVVLPVLVAPSDLVMARYPLLRDKMYLRWEEGPEAIARTLLQKLGREYKRHWVLCHPASYAGPVWIHLVPAPEHRAVSHKYSLRWGPWYREGVISMPDAPGLLLAHTKGDDGLSIPILMDIEPQCWVTFGQGEAPGSQPVDINHGWIRDDAPAAVGSSEAAATGGAEAVPTERECPECGSAMVFGHRAGLYGCSNCGHLQKP